MMLNATAEPAEKRLLTLPTDIMAGAIASCREGTAPGLARRERGGGRAAPVSRIVAALPPSRLGPAQCLIA